MSETKSTLDISLEVDNVADKRLLDIKYNNIKFKGNVHDLGILASTVVMFMCENMAEADKKYFIEVVVDRVKGYVDNQIFIIDEEIKTQ